MTVIAATVSMSSQAAAPVVAHTGETKQVTSGTYENPLGTNADVIYANNGAIQFIEGGNFTINSGVGTSTAQYGLFASGPTGSIVELGNGGGTYTITQGRNPDASAQLGKAALAASGGATLDLSRATVVNLTTDSYMGIRTDGAGSQLKLSKFVMDHMNVATPLRTTGIGIYARESAEIQINEAQVTSVTRLIAADLNSIIRIGNANTRSVMSSSFSGTSGLPITLVTSVNNSQIFLKNLDVNGTGLNMYALKAFSTGGVISIEDTSISTKGLAGVGVLVDAGGTLNLAGTNNISTLGDNSDAIQSSAANLVIADATIETTGDGSLGLNLINGSTTTLTNSTVSTDGVGSTGALVDSTSTLTVNDASITTLGADSLGLDLNAGSTANLTDATIATSGANSTGVSVDGTSTLNLAGTQNISTTGSDAIGILVEKDGTLTGTLTGSVSATGANSDAIVFVDTSNNTPSFALDNAKVTSNNNALLLQAGSLNVSANDSKLTGDITAETGANLDFTMTGSSPANSVLTGAIVNANNTNLVSSTWNVTDDSQIQNLTNDSSIINFVNKDGSTPGLGYDDFKTLTVKEYTGVNSSDIYMNVSLGGDNPAGTSSDKIVIEAGGSMSGPVTLHVNNVGGSGAPTYDGLKLIEAQSGATIDKSEMSIDRGYIPGGAYGYVVRQGQYSEPGDDQSLFLTNFAPKGTTIDENGFLVGAEGVIPPKPTAVAPGTGTGGAFAEGP